MESTILTIKQVCEMTSLSEPTIRRYVRERDDFPNKVKLGPRRVGFKKAEIIDWLNRDGGGVNYG